MDDLVVPAIRDCRLRDDRKYRGDETEEGEEKEEERAERAEEEVWRGGGDERVDEGCEEVGEVGEEGESGEAACGCEGIQSSS